MRIDNLSTVSGDVSLINSASYISGSVPTLVFAQNSSAQSISNNTATVITNWTNVTTQNASEWNATAGTFTATKAGVYEVSAGLLFNNCTAPSIGTEFSIEISKTGAGGPHGYHFAQTTSNVFRPTGMANAVVSMAIGNTITFRAYHAQGGAVALTNIAAANIVTIKELPQKLTRV